MNKEAIPVKVNIMGQEYMVRTDADPKYIKKVAKLVEDRMDEVKQSSPETSSQLRIAVLSAMNIADEFLTITKSKNEVIDKFESKALAITEYIDAKINKLEEP